MIYIKNFKNVNFLNFLYIIFKFESFKEKIMHLLNEAEICHLTTDGWTSQASHSYSGATIYFVDQNFCLKLIRIALKHSPKCA